MKIRPRFALAVIASLVLATVVSAAEKSTGTGKSFKGPVGLQLYSLRSQFAKDVPGTLDEVRDFGIKFVELASTYGQTP